MSKPTMGSRELRSLATTAFGPKPLMALHDALLTIKGGEGISYTVASQYLTGKKQIPAWVAEARGKILDIAASDLRRRLRRVEEMKAKYDQVKDT